MNDQWTDKLSDYLDGELDAAEQAELEEHLSSCAECSAVLERLRQVVDRAQSLEDEPPANDLWSGIAERIGGAPAVNDLAEHRQRRLRDRRFSFSLPQLAAASIALLVLSAGSAWMVSRAGGPAADTTAVGGGEVALVSAVPEIGLATTYDAAVVELEMILDERRDQLDTATVRIIEENLSIVNRAIAQAQRALAMDPASMYLKEHLAATKRQKLEFLRQAAQMAGAVS